MAQAKGATSVRTWSTSGLPQDERVDAWDHMVSSRFAARTIHDGPGRFNASVTSIRLGALQLLELSGSGHTLRRDPVAAQRIGGGLLYVNAQLAGYGTARGRTQTVRAEPGQLGLIASMWANEVEIPDRFRQLVLLVPTELLEPRLADPQVAFGSVVTGAGCAGLVISQITHLARRGGELDRASQSIVASHLLDLLSLTYGQAHAGDRSLRRHLLLQSALDEMERRLHDPTLAPDDIARHVNISVRYLHQMLADRGTTFRGWVVHRRIEHCRAAFDADPARHETTADVARRFGFVDRSHFSRRFTAHIGVSPRAYRRSLTDP